MPPTPGWRRSSPQPPGKTAGAGRPPHMMRHSFALYMLVALHHALDRRFGRTPEERRHFRQVYGHFRQVYGDTWVLVRDLLGHRSEQTTRLVYLNSRLLHEAGEKPQVSRSPRCRNSVPRLRTAAV